MRQTKSHAINGFVYDITQMGAKEARIVLAHILRIVGPAAAVEGESASIAAVINALTDTEVDYLCDTFAKGTMVGPDDGKNARVSLKDQFDNHFVGKYGDMIKWLWAALETNFQSFFSDLGLSPEAVQKVMVNAMGGNLASPTAPSGGSSSPALAASSK